MKTSRADVPRPTNFTQPMFSPTQSQKLWSWLHSVLFTRIILLCKSWTVKPLEGRFERLIRDMILDLLNGEETRWGILNCDADSRPESTKRIPV